MAQKTRLWCSVSPSTHRILSDRAQTEGVHLTALCAEVLTQSAGGYVGERADELLGLRLENRIYQQFQALGNRLAHILYKGAFESAQSSGLLYRFLLHDLEKPEVVREMVRESRERAVHRLQDRLPGELIEHLRAEELALKVNELLDVQPSEM